jgi:ribokinase
VGPAIAVVGSVNVDLVAFCERLPRPGETLTGARFLRAGGGKGANQAVAAARLGARVAMIGCVGDDEHGREALRALREEGIDVSQVQTVGVPTGVALILVAADGENQIVVAPGANAEVAADELDLSDFDGVLCQLEIPPAAVDAASRSARFFCLNAAPAGEVGRETLERADLVVANRYELEALGDIETLPLVAATLGAEGAVLFEAGREVARARPPHVEAVDGTAAGDAFCAALAVSLVEGRPREAALGRACAAGALAASRPGAQPSLPAAAEVDAIIGPDEIRPVQG